MPRRKIKLEDISIQDAFAALEMQGISVQVKEIIEPIVDNPPIQVTKPRIDIMTPQKVGNATAKVSLYAKHSIGNGGVTMGEKGNQHVENNTYAVYGPGVCYVPTALAGHLLHQDAIARQADERMLDRTPKCYIIAQKISNDGQRANVGIAVSEGMFGNIGNLPDNMKYIL